MNTLLKQFKDTLAREGKNITLESGEKIQCFFRKNNDYNNETDTTIIYYPTTENIKVGDLVKFEQYQLLLINQETIENDVYYKSSAVTTNTTINTNDGKIKGLRAYGKNPNSTISLGNNIISTVSGNVELLTTDGEKSQQLKLNDKFNIFGGTYKVENLFYKNGICHIYCERSADEEAKITYTLELDAYELEYKVGDVVTLGVVAKADNSPVTKASIEWSSSDEKIAQVGKKTGEVTFIDKGNVTITATWLEKQVSVRTESLAVESNVVVLPTAKIDGLTSVTYGKGRTYTVTFTNASGEPITFNEYEWDVVANFEGLTTTKESDGSLSVKTANDTKLIGNTFTVQVKVGDVVMDSMSVRIKDFF